MPKSITLANDKKSKYTGDSSNGMLSMYYTSQKNLLCKDEEPSVKFLLNIPNIQLKNALQTALESSNHHHNNETTINKSM